MIKVYVNGIRAKNLKRVDIEYTFKAYEAKALEEPFEWQPLIIQDLAVELSFDNNIGISLKKEDDGE